MFSDKRRCMHIKILYIQKNCRKSVLVTDHAIKTLKCIIHFEIVKKTNTKKNDFFLKMRYYNIF